ncbi:MAG: SH3 domain-containing protein, partial [Oscillospiraceae bacterium]|nr:SH3 domain-containing protein [Oscillospiraceae bacterium]
EPEPTDPEPTEPEPTEPPVTQWNGKVTASTLNIRAEAGTNGRWLGYYVRNTKVVILERKTVDGMEWGKTDKGWISLSYVDIEELVTPPEPTEPEPTEPEPTEPEPTEPEPTEPEPTDPPAAQQTGTVTASKLNIRAEAGTDGRYLGYYVRGTKVTVLETKMIGAVKWGRTDKGWISLQYVKIDEPAPEAVIKTVTADVLRVRSGPGTSYDVAARLHKGTKVTILETKTVNGVLWGRISQGWISMDYVK